MSHPCRSSALPTASTAAWASPLQLWVVARGPTTTAPSRWSTASYPRRTSSTTSAPTAHTASRNRPEPCRRCPDTSPSSPAWSTPTRPSPSWARAAGRGSTPPAGAPWGPPTDPVQTCRREAAGDTQTFPLARPPGWTRWTTDSFDWAEWSGRLWKGLVCCSHGGYKKGGKKRHSLKSTWSSSGCPPVVIFYLIFKFCQTCFLLSHHYKLFFFSFLIYFFRHRFWVFTHQSFGFRRPSPLFSLAVCSGAEISSMFTFFKCLVVAKCLYIDNMLYILVYHCGNFIFLQKRKLFPWRRIGTQMRGLCTFLKQGNIGKNVDLVLTGTCRGPITSMHLCVLRCISYILSPSKTP